MNKTALMELNLSNEVTKLVNNVQLKRLDHLALCVKEQNQPPGLELNKHESYIEEMHNFVLTIENEIVRLQYLITSLSFDYHTVQSLYSTSEIPYIEFFRNALELYHIKFVSILDYVANLVNHVYTLGYPKRDSKLETLSKNKKFKTTQLGTAIKELHRQFSGHKEIRNIVIHERQLNDIHLEKLDQYIIDHNLIMENKTIATYFSQLLSTSIASTKSSMTDDVQKLYSMVQKVIDQLNVEILNTHDFLANSISRS